MKRAFANSLCTIGVLLLIGVASPLVHSDSAAAGQNEPEQAPTTLFTYDRLYVGDDGETHWETVKVDYLPFKYAHNIPAIWAAVDGKWPAQNLMLAGNSPGWDARPLHPPRHRQVFIVLTGITAFTASDGETREYGPGQMILMEDNDSKGHGSYVPSNGPSMVAIIPLADD